MSYHVNKRTMSTRLVERDEPFNSRVFAELIARNIVEGLHNERNRKI